MDNVKGGTGKIQVSPQHKMKKTEAYKKRDRKGVGWRKRTVCHAPGNAIRGVNNYFKGQG